MTPDPAGTGSPPEVRLRDRGPALVPRGLPVRRMAATAPTTDTMSTEDRPDDPVDEVVTPWPTTAVDLPDDPRGNTALCRCGRSGDRPACDGTHRDRRPTPDATPEPPPEAAGPGPSGLGPCVVLEEGGPMRLCGGVTLRLPDGSTTTPPDGTGLCRCGESATRPWCDGSHDGCGVSERG